MFSLFFDYLSRLWKVEEVTSYAAFDRERELNRCQNLEVPINLKFSELVALDLRNQVTNTLTVKQV